MEHPPRGAAVAAVVLVCFPLLVTSTTKAADRCLSKSEARALWPRTYLYWHREGAQRCWSARRIQRSARQAVRGGVGTMTATSPAPLPLSNLARANTGSRPDGARAASASEGDGPKTPLLPPLTVVLPAGLMPPYQERPSDWPRWDWIADARATASEADTPPPGFGEIYSTFDGEQPEVWPRLTRETAPAGAGGLLVVVLSAMVAMLFGLMLARWHMRRLRMR